MGNFDYDKIKDMEYDPNRGCYVGKDGSEYRTSMKSDGTGYKYDYYPTTTYGNAPHEGHHITSDLNGNWTHNYHNADKTVKTSTSGSGCYLTSACMKHMSENFDDKCDELETLRAFRDTYVSKEDIELYYQVAPQIVDEINTSTEVDNIYKLIYDHIVRKSVDAIKLNKFDLAYKIYKESVLLLQEEFINKSEKAFTRKYSLNC